jgi:hypothetical protein
MGIDRILLAAQGYIELDMAEEAIRELDSLSAEDRRCEPALQLRLFILMHSREWQKAVDVCDTMREATPEIVTGYIRPPSGRTHLSLQSGVLCGRHGRCRGGPSSSGCQL